jgi:hypothetical protein
MTWLLDTHPCCHRDFGIRHEFVVLLLLAILAADQPLRAQSATDLDAEGQHWAVILVGLPGDEAHATQFRETADAWQSWLTKSLDVPAERVLRWPAHDGPALTAESIRLGFAELRRTLKPADRLWLFTLGHGNYDGKQAWFHVAGKDPSADDFGRWLGELKCREQVLWLTQQNSGWFVKPLSRPGRIVIAATAADDESNETEFPHALATVLQSPLEKLDMDEDGKVSVAELFAATTREVTRRFQNDKRLPTEHAQLDDNGDGQGTEDLFPKPADDGSTKPNAKIDGALAKKTLLPLRPRKE